MENIFWGDIGGISLDNTQQKIVEHEIQKNLLVPVESVMQTMIGGTEIYKL